MKPFIRYVILFSLYNLRKWHCNSLNDTIWFVLSSTGGGLLCKMNISDQQYNLIKDVNGSVGVKKIKATSV